MFGFGAQENRPTPVGFSTESSAKRILPDGVQLMASADIYATLEGHPVLLLRAGMLVSDELLPKLIRYGVEPQQFVLHYLKDPIKEAQAISNMSDRDDIAANKFPDEPDTDFHASSSSQRNTEARPLSDAQIDYEPQFRTLPMTNPLPEPGGKAQNRILILEPNERTLRRSIDLLTACGVRLGDIHATRLPDQLEWALQKYEPSILFVDESCHPQTSIVARLKELKNQFEIETLVLTVSVPRHRLDLRQQWIDKIDGSGLELMFKPLTPFSLNSILGNYKARLAWRRSQQAGHEV